MKHMLIRILSNAVIIENETYPIHPGASIMLLVTKLKNWIQYDDLLIVVEGAKPPANIIVREIPWVTRSSAFLGNLRLPLTPNKVYYVPLYAHTSDIGKYAAWYDRWLSYNTELPSDAESLYEPWEYYITED